MFLTRSEREERARLSKHSFSPIIHPSVSNPLSKDIIYCLDRRRGRGSAVVSVIRMRLITTRGPPFLHPHFAPASSMNFRAQRDSYAWSIRQRKQALKINTPSSETSHNPTWQEDTRSRRHYPPLFQQRDESVSYTPQSVHVSDRLHLLSYCNSTNRNSRTLIHVVLSPPFHTKRKKLCWRKKVPSCFSLHPLNKKT